MGQGQTKQKSKNKAGKEPWKELGVQKLILKVNSSEKQFKELLKERKKNEERNGPVWKNI